MEVREGGLEAPTYQTASNKLCINYHKSFIPAVVITTDSEIRRDR